jgi:hypothetical protein
LFWREKGVVETNNLDISAIRVTRLGEFSPIWRLFTLGSFFLKITEVAQILCFVLERYKLCINSDKEGFGLHFRRFSHLFTLSAIQLQRQQR